MRFSIPMAWREGSRGAVVAVVALVALLGVLSAGCDDSGGSEGGASAAPSEGGASEQPGRTITDDTGREVTLPGAPGAPGAVDRIAAGTSFALDYLLLLDAPPVVRPDTPLTDLAADPERAEGIPTIAIDHSVGPNVEQIAASDPDVVILSPTFSRFAPTIERAADTKALVLGIDALSDVPAKARLFGELIGSPQRGEALAAELEQQIAAVEQPSGVDGPTVFALFGTPESFFAFLPDSYLGSMVEHLGGEMITGDASAAAGSSQLSPFSFEAMVAADPDVILMVHHGPAGEVAEALRGRPTWAELKAVKNNRVHRISERLFMTSPGPNAVTALRQLRGLLYPEVADGSAR